jgi:hypothetical protein
MDKINLLFQDSAFWTGVIAGIVLGFGPSVWAGHLGNRWTERKNKKSLEAQQKQFVDGLTSVTLPLITSPILNDDDVIERRTKIANEVKRLSQQLFKQDYPEIISIRPENTEYPELPCKWCHRQHKAFAGSKGECTNCRLPLDFWIGCQGETHKS